MANLDKKTIHYLTSLSRIACTEAEQEDLLNDLKKILNYIEQLNEIDTADTPPCNFILEEMVNVMRDDVIGETMPRSTFLENAPSQIGGMIRVPPVIRGK